MRETRITNSQTTTSGKMQNRENWGNRTGFILAVIGAAIGLGNIWRFPYIAYSNGGGTFLISYFIALFSAGIPIIILEVAIGHKFKLSSPSAFFKMSRKSSWIGWFQASVAFVVTVYYVVIVAWVLNYLCFSFSLSWGTHTRDFFYKEFLEISSGPLNIGGVDLSITFFTIIIWILVWLTLSSGIRKGIELVAKIFMPILFVGIIILLARVITLKGASNGLEWLFNPHFDSIFDYKTWSAAYGQIFFSLGIGSGIMIAYASYLPDKADIANNATMTAFINSGFSILAAIVIFSILGYAAHMQNVPMKSVAGQGIGLAFITIPMAINLMPAATIVGPLFFFALFLAGFTSLISVVEVGCSAIIDSYGVRRKKTVLILCTVGCIISLIFTTRGGLYILDIVDYFISNFGLVVAGIFEVIFIAWFIKLKIFKEYINAKSDFSVGVLWKFWLKYFLPLFLGYMAIGNLIKNIISPYESYSLKSIICYGWSLIIIAILLSFALCYKKTIHHEEESKK